MQQMRQFGRSVIMGCLLAGPASAGNPIIENKGVCDPQMRVFGDRVWLYATHDHSVASKGYAMYDWWVWSSADLVNWTHESTLSPRDTYYKNPSGVCWATDAATRNGKYYFYFSMGVNNIGVVVGDSPKGPWTDPLGKALIAHDLTPVEERDPGLLMDDDGQAYIVFGCWDYYIARLNADMISLAEAPRKIEIHQPEGPYGKGKTDDKPFLHKRDGKYYLSWGCFYAMSDSVYGPYACKGSIIVQERTAPEFQKGLLDDRHGSFFEFNNQWYFACNDHNWPGTHPFFRDSVITYVHYRDSGEIEPVFLDRIGVGQYDAAAGRIEAENYFKSAGVSKRQCPAGGFELRGIQDGSWVLYPKVMNLPANAKATFRVSRPARGLFSGGTIEIRANEPKGKLLGSCRIPATGDWSTYQTVACRLRNPAGITDICLVFKGPRQEFCRLDWINFK